MSASLLLVLVAGVFVGWSANRFLSARQSVKLGGRSTIVGAIYDGSTYTVYPAKQNEAGFEIGGTLYPAGVCRVGDAGSIRMVLVAADAVALANHRTLEVARQTIALRALFKGGGDLRRWLEIAAVTIPIVVYLLLYSSFGAVQNTLNQQSADLKMVKEQLSKPLVVQPQKNEVAP